jgi:hypothetical protein
VPYWDSYSPALCYLPLGKVKVKIVPTVYMRPVKTYLPLTPLFFHGALLLRRRLVVHHLFSARTPRWVACLLCHSDCDSAAVAVAVATPLPSFLVSSYHLKLPQYVAFSRDVVLLLRTAPAPPSPSPMLKQRSSDAPRCFCVLCTCTLTRPTQS